MVLAEPLRVSPLIKVITKHFKAVNLSFVQTCRWTALLVGIWWGNKRWQANKATEDEVSSPVIMKTLDFICVLFQHRAYVAKMQPIWDAEKAEKAAKANRETMIYLAKATGTPIPADF